jgi:serine/threonine-protein kinase
MLAKGQAGPLFEATDTTNHQPVALKVLWPEFSQDQQEVKRFVRAMKTMLPVRHPHLVSLYGAGRSGTYCWMAMEFVDGESLAQVLKKTEPANRLDWQEVLRIGVHISRALAFAHHRRILHRNITPPNILIRSGDRTAKLGDLMLSKALEGSLAAHITSKGQLLGDLHYLPPERTSGQIGEVDERADLYSLGATLYTALTGRPPFQGKSLMETILKIRQEKLVSMRSLQPAVPAELDQIVMKMMAKIPGDRYQTAAEVLTTLQKYATRQGVVV